jgi:hypothetical protein
MTALAYRRAVPQTLAIELLVTGWAPNPVALLRHGQ